MTSGGRPTRHGACVRRLLLLPLLAVAGCGGSAQAPEVGPPAASTPRNVPGPLTETTPPPRRRTTPPLLPAVCGPAPAANCTAHTGTVLTIESVDRDGDGDLHVIASGGSVTAPGITVFDVSAALRPARDPRPGDRVTGAGPVYRGSLRQRQIQVTSFRVARATG